MEKANGKAAKRLHAAEHQPGLVAIPDRRDRVHHQIARGSVGREAEEDADAKIESIEQHVEKDPQSEDQRPDRDQIDTRHHPPPDRSGPAWPNASTGLLGRPASTRPGPSLVKPARVDRFA